MEGRLTGLDALRGIAALCVVINHSEPSVMPLGYLSVDLFLMLSGFIMARTYEARMGAGQLSTFRFLAIRYRRLLPAYALGCAIGLPMAFLLDWPAAMVAGYALAAMLFLPSPIGPQLYPLNPPGWSLTFELIANALHAAAFAKLSDRALLMLAGLMATAFIALMVLQGEVLGGHRVEGMAQSLARCLAAYIVGVLLFRNRAQFRRSGAGLALISFPTLVILGEFAPTILFVSFFILVACPLIVVACSGESSACRYGAFLGGISYPLYATHFVAIQWAMYFGWHAAIGAAIALVGVSAFWLVSNFRISEKSVQARPHGA